MRAGAAHLPSPRRGRSGGGPSAAGPLGIGGRAGPGRPGLLWSGGRGVGRFATLPATGAPPPFVSFSPVCFSTGGRCQEPLMLLVSWEALFGFGGGTAGWCPGGAGLPGIRDRARPSPAPHLLCLWVPAPSPGSAPAALDLWDGRSRPARSCPSQGTRSPCAHRSCAPLLVSHSEPFSPPCTK